MLVDFICNFHRPHLPEVRVGECGYHVTAWRTTCLYGVTYSRASPRLFAYITSLVSGIDRTSPRCEWGEVVILSPHGARRAYTVFLTAVHLRCTIIMLSSSVTYRPHAFRLSLLMPSLVEISFYSLGSRTNNGLGSNRGSANTWRSASRDSSDSDASPIVIPAAVSALCISSSAISGVLLS